MLNTKNIVIYVHGKGGSAEEAEHYKPLFPDSEVIGFDYRAQTPWEAKEEFPKLLAAARQGDQPVEIIANSIGAFFAMSAFSCEKIAKAYFISPVVDMKRLISDMMRWGNVTEEELQCRKEIRSVAAKKRNLSDMGHAARKEKANERKNDN